LLSPKKTKCEACEEKAHKSTIVFQLCKNIRVLEVEKDDHEKFCKSILP
jgi:hypothetical protein